MVIYFFSITQKESIERVSYRNFTFCFFCIDLRVEEPKFLMLNFFLNRFIKSIVLHKFRILYKPFLFDTTMLISIYLF